VAVHYAVLFGLVAGLFWLAVPRALDEVRDAVAVLPETRSELRQEASESQGVKHDVLIGLARRLEALPSREELLEPGLEITRHAVELVVGMFFVFASAAYWIFERDRAVQVVLSFVPRRRRKVVSDTWNLIDLKLGAFVRGQLLLVVAVAATLSAVFWAIGEPYWLLVGAFAGVVELVPIIGPLAAGGLAVAVGLTASWTTALYAGIAVLIVRVLEDYLVMPRVLGSAVGLSPLIVLVAVFAAGIVMGGLAVLLAIPVAAVLATLLDVIVLQNDPADADTPTVMFPATDTED
jgi:predicted PurR-regulated permease PerM